MENASKALIIAGAILLSILIIALGIYVFNMARGVTDTNQLSELEVSQFNQPFTNYRGKTMGTGVIDLLDKVIANTVTNKDADDRLPDIIYLDKTNTVTNKLTGTATSVYELPTSGDDFNALNNNFSDYTKYKTDNSNSSCKVIKSISGETNSTVMGTLRSNIAEKHTYQVFFNTDANTGLIDYIIIVY